MIITGPQSSEPTGGNDHPAARIAFISETEQEMVPVGRAEIRRFAAEVLTVVKNPVEGASAWAVACGGIAVAAALSLITLYGTKSKTSQPATWVLAAHWVVVLTFSGIGIFSWWVDSKLRA